MASFNVSGVKFEGIDPSQFAEEKLKKFVSLLNDEALKIESDLVKDTPSNAGRLRGGWSVIPASMDKPKAIIGQSVKYFLPVEMGRKPGKGISEKGQKEVARWAKLVLGLKDRRFKVVKSGEQLTTDQFAMLLSIKYKRKGRPAVGFVGLAKPGETPSTTPTVPDEPLNNSLLADAFNRITNRLERL